MSSNGTENLALLPNQADCTTISQQHPLPNFTAFGSLGRPARNAKRRQMAGDVGRIESRAGKRPDRMGDARWLALVTGRGVIQVRPEHTHGGLERVRAD